MGKKHNDIPITVHVPSNSFKLRFSFEYYDKTSNEYCLSCWDQQQIRNTLLQLQDICTKSFKDLLNESRVRHFSQVDWKQTTKKDGFPDKRVNNLPAFHFALLGVNKQLARVFGAYSEGTFYIVWFDLNHDIWPSPLKNT